jgi:hypothetical protein
VDPATEQETVPGAANNKAPRCAEATGFLKLAVLQRARLPLVADAIGGFSFEQNSHRQFETQATILLLR